MLPFVSNYSKSGWKESLKKIELENTIPCIFGIVSREKMEPASPRRGGYEGLLLLFSEEGLQS